MAAEAPNSHREEFNKEIAGFCFGAKSFRFVEPFSYKSKEASMKNASLSGE